MDSLREYRSFTANGLNTDESNTFGAMSMPEKPLLKKIMNSVCRKYMKKPSDCQLSIDRGFL